MLNELSAEFLDEKELAVANAQVEVIWYGPSGEIRSQWRRTDSEGVSQFTMKPSSSGAWDLWITAIHKEGYESLHLQKELTCQVVLAEKTQIQPDRSSSIQVEPLLGIMTPPGITIKDKLVLNRMRAELIGEFCVEEQDGSNRSIADAKVSGYWEVPNKPKEKFIGTTDKKRKFISSIRTSGTGKYTLVISSIVKKGYKFSSLPLQKSWNGISIPIGLSQEGDFDETGEPEGSVLKRYYHYSAAENISVNIRRHALQRAIEEEDGLGLAYVINFLMYLNRRNINNSKHTNANERRKDDIQWLKSTYYDKLKIKHFIFPPI